MSKPTRPNLLQQSRRRGFLAQGVCPGRFSSMILVLGVHFLRQVTRPLEFLSVVLELVTRHLGFLHVLLALPHVPLEQKRVLFAPPRPLFSDFGWWPSARTSA